MTTTAERMVETEPPGRQAPDAGGQEDAATGGNATVAAEAPPISRPAADTPLATFEDDGAITVPMEIVALGLGVPVETVLANLRAGLVYQTTERGVGEDAGRFRITFRFRSRECRLIVEQCGRILPVPGTAPRSDRISPVPVEHAAARKPRPQS